MFNNRTPNNTINKYKIRQTFSPDLLFMSYMIQIIILVVVIILAIIATLIMKNNRVLAGVLFIIAAVVSLFVTNLVAMVLWIIVAVKLFIKKDNNNNIKQGKTNGINHNQDHMSQEKTLLKAMDDSSLQKAIDRVKNVKKGEFFVARTLQPGADDLKSDKAFISFLEDTFTQLLKFYV